MNIFQELKKKKTIQNAISLGAQKESSGDQEGAYEQYSIAAELGSAEAMVRIATMYYAKDFRPVETSNIMELIMQGMPIFPWNTVTKKVPDHKSALEWFRKAADLGNPIACCMAGSMLCEGVGCKADKTAGVAYLEMAASAGLPEARQALCIYREHTPRFFAQDQYEALLKQFEAAAAAGSDEAYTLYDQLKCGHPQYLARLGYAIITGKNAGRKGFGPFQYSLTPSGIPLLPVGPKRVAWKTFLRVDLNAFPDEDVLIAFSSDIDPQYMLGYVHRLTPAGTAVYRSPEFGWLREEKYAHLFRIDRGAALDEETLAKLAGDFHLIEEEYHPGNVAFLTEYGEKEYSVELAAIHDGKVDILWRYTIGGPDTVSDYFEPELLELKTN